MVDKHDGMLSSQGKDVTDISTRRMESFATESPTSTSAATRTSASRTGTTTPISGARA
jgi:hypothetical protein